MQFCTGEIILMAFSTTEPFETIPEAYQSNFEFPIQINCNNLSEINGLIGDELHFPLLES
jgi:hypothetical protein